MGAAAADYDNDGHVDLFVAGVRTNQLLRNRGDGTFEDVTARTGIASGDWAVAAGWFDYDNDGRLDLFVVNYVQWSPDTNRYCGDQSRGLRIYCHPRFFAGLPNRLYRNRGDGKFEDVSARAGLLSHVGKGMSVAFADYDHDGHVDAFVTNDTVPNFLFRNAGDGTFRETALLAGVSVPASGRPVSGMGVDFQDYDNDGWEDIHFTALSGETFPLFRNEGRGTFVETTQPSGLAALDGEILGLVRRSWLTSTTMAARTSSPPTLTRTIASPNRRRPDGTSQQSFHQQRCRDASATRPPNPGSPAPSRSTAGAVSPTSTTTAVWIWPCWCWARGRNCGKTRRPPAARWLIVRLVGTRSNRDGIGARVIVGNQVRTMTTAAGYASSSHAGVHFGLGTRTEVERLEVQWPSGTRQIVEKVKTNQVIEIKEPGSGLNAQGSGKSFEP